MHGWLDAFLYFLPAGFANMAPLFANKIPGLNKWQTPMDFGKSYKGVRIFGQNKSFRGLACGIVLAGLAAYVIYQFSSPAYNVTTYVVGGALMGLGALLGDAVESFFKRRAGIKPGNAWFPFDQLDYIIGGLLVSYPVLTPSASTILRVIALYFGLHLLVSYIGYLLGFKEKPI